MTAPPAGASYALSFSPSGNVAGTAVTVSAQLVDAAGAPVRIAQRLVRWNTNGGLLLTASSATNSLGIATASISLPAKAGVRYQVSASDDIGIVGISQQFTSVAGPPAEYVVTPPEDTSAVNGRVSVVPLAPVVGSTIAITAQLADRQDNPVGIAGRTVTWTTARIDASGGITPGTGSFAAPTSTTDAQGIATVNFTVGTALDTGTVIIATDDRAIVGYSPTIITIAGPASRYVVYVDPSETDPPAGAQVRIFAQTADANGNPTPTPSHILNWTVTGTGATLSSATTYATAAVTLTTSSSAGASYVVSVLDINGFQGSTSAITTQPQASLASIATGFESSSVCGTSSSGAAWCWGDNSVGQLGNGTKVSRTLPGRSAGNLSLKSIAVGSSFSCGLTSAGAAYCWGNNADGELGDNSTASHTVPAPVAASVDFQALSVGTTHACGLATNGDAYCWGKNTYGQLGLQSGSPYAAAPVKVDGGLSFAAISAGGYYTCGIATTGTTYCWGLNSEGQLGDGTGVNRSTPLPVAGALQFTALSTGAKHACGITTAGSAYCWGSNEYSQLGSGTQSAPVTTPRPTRGGLAFSAIAAGGLHTCAITTDGLAYCWGDNSQLELGTDSPASGTGQPLAVIGGLRFKSISAAGTVTPIDSDYYYPTTFDSYSCGITTGGAAYCWGSNQSGQLGIGAGVPWGPGPLKVAGQH